MRDCELIRRARDGEIIGSGRQQIEALLKKLDESIENAIENACEKLPNQFWIDVSIERNAGTVELYDGDGDGVDFPSNRECMADEINDAVEHAIELQAAEDAADEADTN